MVALMAHNYYRLMYAFMLTAVLAIKIYEATREVTFFVFIIFPVMKGDFLCDSWGDDYRIFHQKQHMNNSYEKLTLTLSFCINTFKTIGWFNNLFIHARPQFI